MLYEICLDLAARSDEALRRENLELKRMLKAKQVQEEVMVKGIADKEAQFEEQISDLKSQLLALQKSIDKNVPPPP